MKKCHSWFAKSHKKVFLVANKVDNFNHTDDANEFYSLGLGNIYCISSISGSGTGDLLDEVVKEFIILPQEETPELPKFAVIGRPNVGKIVAYQCFAWRRT